MARPVPSVHRKEHLTLVLKNAVLYIGSVHFCLIHFRHCMYYYPSFFFYLNLPSYKWIHGYLVVFCKRTIALNNSEARVWLLLFFLNYFWLLCL